MLGWTNNISDITDLPENFWPSSFLERDHNLLGKCFRAMFYRGNVNLSGYKINQDFLNNLNKISGQCQGMLCYNKAVEYLSSKFTIPSSLYYRI